jgi:hypothetical protein|tara:strand:- start:270 stop:761 length:492 start_codon:yes stop_codon:yes gene_type:complete
MKKRLEYRMYGLVPYNISPIQQGIQFGHAVVEYGLKHGKSNVINDKVDTYTQWAKNDKTFIILNGGTTNNSPIYDKSGTLNKAKDELAQMGIQTATFYEPDLGDQLTAVVFLVDERVWDKENYSTYDFIKDEVSEMEYYETLFSEEHLQILEMRHFLSKYKLA